MFFAYNYDKISCITDKIDIINMGKISEKEFAKICNGIYEDREVIWKHNPIGTQEETLLWMLMSCLHSYLSLSDVETPCFNGKPTAETYKQAIISMLKNKKSESFEEEKYLEELVK